MSDEVKIIRNSIGFLGLLTITFTVLKLEHIIAWSWFWILSPVLIPILVCLLIFGIYLILIYIYTHD